eukprot:351520-Chlamydomonas_euryale.AAC.5
MQTLALLDAVTVTSWRWMTTLPGLPPTMPRLRPTAFSLAYSSPPPPHTTTRPLPPVFCCRISRAFKLRPTTHLWWRRRPAAACPRRSSSSATS